MADLDTLRQTCAQPSVAAPAASEWCRPTARPGHDPQVAALAVMLELAGGPQAGLLGCGWPAVLRTLSNLAALQVHRRLWLTAYHLTATLRCF
jgi:hypothetical protein